MPSATSSLTEFRPDPKNVSERFVRVRHFSSRARKHGRSSQFAVHLGRARQARFSRTSRRCRFWLRRFRFGTSGDTYRKQQIERVGSSNSSRFRVFCERVGDAKPPSHCGARSHAFFHANLSAASDHDAVTGVPSSGFRSRSTGCRSRPRRPGGMAMAILNQGSQASAGLSGRSAQ